MFFSWYNDAHRRAGIGLMTPAAVHEGRAKTMRDARHQVLLTAYAAHPERFVRKPTQPPVLPHAVWINPPKEESTSQDRAGATISIADDPRVGLNVEGIGWYRSPWSSRLTRSRLRQTKCYTKCQRQVSQTH
jgi:hypothetical protein